MLKLIIFLTVFISGSLMAGTADLALELEFNEVNGVVYDQTGEFFARITNLGPDVAGNNSSANPISLLSSIIQDSGYFVPEIHFAPGPQNNPDCTFLFAIGSPPPGGNVTYAYTITIPLIAVNETIECHGIFSRSFESGIRSVTWAIDNSVDIDPNSNNDSQVITFGIPPQVVPINNIFVLILLFTLMIYFGYKSKQI